MRTISKLLIVILTLAVLVGSWFYFTRGHETLPSTFDIGQVKQGSLVAAVTATGTLGPLTMVQVGSQVSGTIYRLHADFNQKVKQGTVIAEIEPSLFQALVAQAEANLKSAEAALDKSRVAILDAKRQLDRISTLREKSLVSESELDASRFAHQAAMVEEKVAQAAVAQTTAALQQAKVNFAHTKIKAPVDGIIISRDVNVGQTVAASLQAPVLFTLAKDLKQMQIETQVDEAFIGTIKANQPVMFSVFAYPGRQFTGRVAQVRLNPKVESGVVKYNCIIRVDNHDLDLKPGMTATVTIEIAKHENIFKAPNAALRYVPQLPPEELDALRNKLGKNEAVIWAVKGPTLEPITVQVGLVGDKETEISGHGLRPDLDIALPQTQENSNKKPPRAMRFF